MRATLWCLALSALFVGAGCTRELPEEGRPCPCGDGWSCCMDVNRCARSAADCPAPPEDVNECVAPGIQPPPEGRGRFEGTTNDPSRTITPVACGTDTPPSAWMSYAPGYVPDPTVVDWVQGTLAEASLTDQAEQLRGRSPFSYSDLQRSADTTLIRGFRYRDGPRGMNLGEDFEGTFPGIGTVNGLRVGYSTAFPVSIARGASFDIDLEHAIGEAIGDELQAANQTVLLAPCVNLLRHPLWGRAQETYGEDPFAAGRLGTAMAVGAQHHVVAVAKHFAAYGLEHNRDASNAVVDEQALRETYGRPFRMLIQDAGVSAVMAGVNKVNGTKAALSRHLLTDILRSDFGFRGFVLSDFWPFWNNHATVDTQTLRATARSALAAGLDVELPWSWSYSQLESLVTLGDGLTADVVAASAARILEQKFRFNAQSLTGCFGLGAPKTHYSQADGSISGDADHDLLAERSALESMVLLKNDGPTLPITARSPGQRVVVLGANVTYTVTDNEARTSTTSMNFATNVLTGDLGASRVFPNKSNSVDPFHGIKATAPVGVTVTAGSTAADAKGADFVVVVAGLTPGDEGQEYTGASDRAALGLDAKQIDRNLQNRLITDVAALGKPMVVVLEGGSVIDMPWLDAVQAVVMAWYPGQRGGMALGHLLWGTTNFSGKLPLTWAQRLTDYPLFSSGDTAAFDYDVGYRFFDRERIAPLFPFGHGLSYTSFEYRKLQVGCSTLGKGGVLPVVVNVANVGGVAGDETVMVFVSFPSSTARRPVKELKGFARVHLEPGDEKQVTVPIRLSDLDYFQMDGPAAISGKWVIESGDVTLMVGGSASALPLSATVTVDGYALPPS